MRSSSRGPKKQSKKRKQLSFGLCVNRSVNRCALTSLFRSLTRRRGFVQSKGEIRCERHRRNGLMCRLCEASAIGRDSARVLQDIADTVLRASHRLCCKHSRENGLLERSPSSFGCLSQRGWSRMMLHEGLRLRSRTLSPVPQVDDLHAVRRLQFQQRWYFAPSKNGSLSFPEDNKGQKPEIFPNL